MLHCRFHWNTTFCVTHLFSSYLPHCLPFHLNPWQNTTPPECIYCSSDQCWPSKKLQETKSGNYFEFPGWQKLRGLCGGVCSNLPQCDMRWSHPHGTFLVWAGRGYSPPDVKGDTNWSLEEYTNFTLWVDIIQPLLVLVITSQNPESSQPPPSGLSQGSSQRPSQLDCWIWTCCVWLLVEYKRMEEDPAHTPTTEVKLKLASVNIFEEMEDWRIFTWFSYHRWSP